jgi:hypothetical protein
MRLLVVEGNPREIWEKRESRGGIPYHKRFQRMLMMLAMSDDGDEEVLDALKEKDKIDKI